MQMIKNTENLWGIHTGNLKTEKIKYIKATQINL